MAKTIGIVGSRRRNTKEDKDKLRQLLLKAYETGDIIVSGGCPKGADKFAEELAEELGIPIEIHHADWDNLEHPDARIKENWHGKYDANAGFRRNIFIAQDADILIACVAPDRKGGAEDTIRKYRKMGKKELILC